LAVAYDEDLEVRIREVLADQTDVTERKMFGGIAFMVGGNICCGVIGDDLMVRLGAEAADEALDRPHTRPFDFTGRPSRGAVFIEPGGTGDDAELRDWVERGLAFVATLPPKS
jgi:TfoX/Sxy family transcriptional regulator of competence genes